MERIVKRSVGEIWVGLNEVGCKKGRWWWNRLK